jgi:hypothetical protein
MKRPVSIGIKDLSVAVQKAVKAVNPKLDHTIHVGPIITGIILKPEQLPIAEKLAADLSGHVKTSAAASLGGAAIEPGVLIAGGHIICGFIAPEITFHE